jgi:hypothetical protein
MESHADLRHELAHARHRERLARSLAAFQAADAQERPRPGGLAAAAALARRILGAGRPAPVGGTPAGRAVPPLAR